MGIVVFAVGQQLAVGRILVPQFGDPVLVTDRLIFTEPGSKPHRLICIATDGGKKIWEIANRAEELKAWCVVGKDVIVSAGPDLYRCDTQLGRLELLHRTKGIYTPFVEDQSDGTLLVASGTARMGYLARIDARTGRVVWKRERIEWWLRGANKVLLCSQATRIPAQGGGYQLVSGRWVGVSKEDGEVAWSCPPAGAAAAVGEYFVLFLKDTFTCLNQVDGSTVKSLKIHTEPYPNVSLAVQGQRVLVEMHGNSLTKAGPLFFSLSLPDCEWGPLEESVWKAVTRRPKAEDQAFSYTSTISAGWERTSILRTDLKSGASSVLYEEEVPRSIRERRETLRDVPSGSPIDTFY